MPHINRIRVNNVKYNFGTQYFDDFVMRFDGRNTLYDLANGGGKSVLMLLLMQNMIPNCTLDDKQPLEKLFRGEGASTVIHSLIEWRLDDHLVKDDYKYMLTGFCARKAKEGDDQSGKGRMASVEYFNYVIFYRSYNEHDIVNLPLTDGKERITYTGLRSLLKNLERQNYQLKVHLFDRKGEYQSFVSEYGIYESEWEIIRGINKTEGHVRTYFETNYRTARKVVEDLLIEEIIQKAFTGHGETSEHGQGQELMADTLFTIRDQLEELAKKQSQIHHYDRQAEVLGIFRDRLKTFDTLYSDEQALHMEMSKMWQTVLLMSKVCERDLAASAREKEKTGERRTDLIRKMETVRIQTGRERLAVLENESRQLVAEEDELKKRRLMTRDQLSLKESMNDYLDYLAELKKYKEAQETVSKSGLGENNQLAGLKYYARLWSERYADLKGQLEEKLTKEEAQKTEYKTKRKLLKEEAIETDRRIAVLKDRLVLDEAGHKELNQSFNALRDEAGLLIIEELATAMRMAQAELEAQEKECSHMQETLEANEKEALDLTRAIEDAGRQQAQAMIDRQEGETFLAQWEAGLARLEGLLKVYRAEDAGELREKMLTHYRKLSWDLENKKQELSAQQHRLTQLKENNPLPVSTGAAALIDYLRTCHNLTCVYGADYLKDVEADDRARLLERLPMLPYTVIVKEGISLVLQDTMLPEKDFGDSMIPVIGLKDILSENTALPADQIYVAGRGKAYYLNDSLIQKEISGLEEARTVLQRQVSRLEDQIVTCESDLEDVTGYVLIYDKHKEEKESQLRQALDRLQESEVILADAAERSRVLKEEAERLAKDQTLGAEKLEKLQRRRDLLRQLKAVHQSLEEAGEQLTSDRQQLDEHLKQLIRLNHEMDVLDTGMEEIAGRCERLNGELLELNQEYGQLWMPYLPEEGEEIAAPVDDYTATGEENDLSKTLDNETLRSRFMGLREAYEQAHINLADKHKLMESYQQAMDRLLESIQIRNIDVAEMEALHQKGSLYRSDKAALQQQREQLSQLGDKIAEIAEKIAEAEAGRNELLGSINQAVEAHTRRFGSYKAVNLNHQNPEEYMENAGKLADEAKEKLGSVDKTIERLTKESYYLEGLKSNLERMLKENHVQPDLTQSTFSADTNLRRKYQELTDKAESLYRQRNLRRESFDKDKAKTLQSLELLGCHELAADIRDHVSLPEDAAGAAALAEDINETISLINIEKERTSGNMDNLLTIRSNFEQQCLQICMSIKKELERLTKMSVINMDDERIQMLGLQIPYVRESFYAQKMTDYIQETVSGADAFATEEETRRYLLKQMSWKRLFAVIVEDMDAIRLTLYKRERIREQSRYLRYEEAVGSTGQSQGIYIQFLIAVIHYISSVHAGSVGAGKLRKTIFIDNPFGAAKDVYIWKPIFALLAANSVQMIVPSRGATPAITGMFDVNYVLGQKLMGSRQQTVVVDYHSNIVIEEMEYVKIDYEQQTFDFI